MTIMQLAQRIGAAPPSGPLARWRTVALNDIWADSTGPRTAAVEIDPDDSDAVNLLIAENGTRLDQYRWTVRTSNWKPYFDAGFVVVVKGNAERDLLEGVASVTVYLAQNGVDRFFVALDGRNLTVCLDAAEKDPPRGTFSWTTAPVQVRGLVVRGVSARATRTRRRDPGEKNWAAGRSATTLVVPNKTWNVHEATHRVVWENGRLSFPDHPFGVESPDSEAFDAIVGAADCGCRWLLAAWRNGDRLGGFEQPYAVDDRFAGAVDDRNDASEFRREFGERLADDPLSLGLRERSARRSRAKAFVAAFNGHSYRCAGRLYASAGDVPDGLRVPHRQAWGDGPDMRVHVEVSDDDEPTVECAGAGRRFLFRVRSPWWSQNVDSVGRMLGVLVCDVVEWGGRSGGLPVRVVAGRPGPGLTVYRCEAKVTWDESGEHLPVPSLSWVKV